MKLIDDEEHAALERDRDLLVATSGEVVRLQAELKRVTAERDEAEARVARLRERIEQIALEAESADLPRWNAPLAQLEGAIDDAKAALAEPASDWLAKHDRKIVDESDAVSAAWIRGETGATGLAIADAVQARDKHIAEAARAKALEEAARYFDAWRGPRDHEGCSLNSSFAGLQAAAYLRSLTTPSASEPEHRHGAAEAARRAALEEAARVAEDWTCKGCDSDTAGDLAMAIRALVAPGRALATATSEPAPDVRVAITPVGRSNATHPLMQGIVVPAPDAKPTPIPRVHSSNFSEPLNEDPEILAACVDAPHAPDAKPCANPLCVDGRVPGEVAFSDPCPRCGGGGADPEHFMPDGETEAECDACRGTGRGGGR